ncbi:MAG: pilus assembly protein PilM [Planctomycetota bacterium]
MDAVGLAKEDEFDEAIGLLSRLGKTRDFRYGDLVDDSKQAIEKVRKIAEQRRATAAAALEDSREAIASEDHRRVVDILKSAPQKLLPENVRQAFQRSKGFLENQGSLESRIQDAIAKKDWCLVGPLLQQITQLEPENESYVKLAGKVSRRLITNAENAFEVRKYPLAIKCLDSVPELGHDERYQQLRSRVENIVWLRSQFDSEPFDTPTLGRLAVRLQKDEPGDEENEQRVKELSASLKQGVRPARSQYPCRAGRSQSWIGGELGQLNAISRIARPDLPELRGKWGQMNVAIGLALQGLGEGRITSNLTPAKGLLKRLTRKKVSVAYGFDIGSHSIKVVGLQATEDGIEMIGGFVHPYEQPICRPGYDEDSLTVVVTAIQEIQDKHEFGDAPIWISLPAGEVITRFTRLPPVSDKQANQLVDKEIKERIPFEVETLHIDRWIAPLEEECPTGRPAVVSAIKRTAIEQRLERIGLTGLNVAGMQSDPIALVNLVSYEFADELEERGDDEARTPTIAIVDCGAQTTTLVLVSRNAHWIWTVEIGGEDLTGLLAREVKQSRMDAEPLKFAPHTLPSPASNYGPIENRLDEWRSRLSKLSSDAMELNPSFEVVNAFGCGGTTLTHQWYRRVMAD